MVRVPHHDPEHGRRVRVEDSRAAREKSTSGDVLRRYVGATPLGAGMIPAAIECNYPKRLLKAGWWYMSLFQQPARVGPHRAGTIGAIRPSWF